MPHRSMTSMTLWIGILGVLAVAIVILLGRNLEQAAGRGPRWKRRLLAAGLTLLAVFGYQPTADARHAPHKARRVRKSLATNPDWQALMAAYHRAEKFANKPAGTAPFRNEAEKRGVLKDLDRALVLTRRLSATKALTRTEAKLLILEIQEMTSRVKLLAVSRPLTRPTGVRPTCYAMPVPPPKYRESVQRLRKRQPLLKRLAGQSRLHPTVIELLRKRIESDIAQAENAVATGYGAARREEATRAKRLGRLLHRIWKRIWRRVPRSRPPATRPRPIIRTCYRGVIRRKRSSSGQERTELMSKRLSSLERLEQRGTLATDISDRIRNHLDQEMSRSHKQRPDNPHT